MIAIVVAPTADVSKAENRALHGRRVRQRPSLPAVVRSRRLRARVRSQIAAAKYSVAMIAERHRNSSRARRAHQRRVIRIPSIAAIARSQNPRHRRAAGGNPRIFFSFGSDASSARGKRSLPIQRRRHIRGDGLPIRPIGGANIGKHAIHRIAVRDAAVRSPEGHAIVERIHGLVGEFNRPVRAAVHGLVDLEVRRVIPDGHEVGHFVAHALHIAELVVLRSRHDAGCPSISAVLRHHERAARPRGPDHARVHRTNRNQQLRSAALLHREFRPAMIPMFLRRSKGCASSNQQHGQR